jgi:hypothetical protein
MGDTLNRHDGALVILKTGISWEFPCERNSEAFTLYPRPIRREEFPSSLLITLSPEKTTKGRISERRNPAFPGKMEYR